MARASKRGKRRKRSEWRGRRMTSLQSPKGGRSLVVLFPGMDTGKAKRSSGDSQEGPKASGEE